VDGELAAHIHRLGAILRRMLCINMAPRSAAQKEIPNMGNENDDVEELKKWWGKHPSLYKSHNMVDFVFDLFPQVLVEAGYPEERKYQFYIALCDEEMDIQRQFFAEVMSVVGMVSWCAVSDNPTHRLAFEALVHTYGLGVRKITQAELAKRQARHRERVRQSRLYAVRVCRHPSHSHSLRKFLVNFLERAH
jgi:hypothetical protein